MKIAERLRRLIKEGYVLHGSPLKQKTLIPTKQLDYNKKVLCFTNIPKVAFFHAVTSHKRAGKNSKSSYDLEKIKFYATKNIIDTINFGYIYTYKKDKLIEPKRKSRRDWEWISYKNVKPEKIIKVYPKDFRLNLNILK